MCFLSFFLVFPIMFLVVLVVFPFFRSGDDSFVLICSGFQVFRCWPRLQGTEFARRAAEQRASTAEADLLLNGVLLTQSEHTDKVTQQAPRVLGNLRFSVAFWGFSFSFLVFLSFSLVFLIIYCAQTLIVVNSIVVNFLAFLVIPRHHGEVF